MKKILYSFIATLGIFGMTACSDMLETESSRQLFEADINQKTDSVFYAYGIMQAMQQLADQYYFQNEMRGDLVKTTAKASTHLQSLSSFTADASNKYDSVYLYYKVINNCNYYLAHRDTTLATGSQKVVSNEYAAVASFRAWTYLQLARQYGAVPYVTEPVTTIAQINANTSMTNYTSILTAEAQMLEGLKARYSEDQLSVPTFGTTSRTIGNLNWRNNNNQVTKAINPRKCFVPLNVVLGDIYLELGEYEKAATCYFQYLRYMGQTYGISSISVAYVQSIASSYSLYSPIFKNLTEMPVDYDLSQNAVDYKSALSWINSFTHQASPGDVISYIPMAVNYTMGQTTDIPAAFGYNYYGTERKNEIETNDPLSSVFNCPKTDNIQVVPSQSYCDSARNAQYYYYTEKITTAPFNWIVKSASLGDARAFLVSQGSGADSSYVYTFKPSTAYVPLYRNATVWLHLAEAINRMGYPDAAFAVLKTGLHSELEVFRYLEVPLKDAAGNDSVDAATGKVVLDMTQSHIDDIYYLTPESYTLLTTKLPFLSAENSVIFKNGTTTAFCGIHFHGAGATGYQYSSYKYKSVVEAKIADINKKFSLGLTTYTKDDYINAMEDLLCDEYAMEFAFEGTRYSDLRRIALHKNQAGTYGGGFGDKWLSRMLQNNAAGITTLNCYLPYK